MTDTDQLKLFLARALPWPADDEPQTYVGIHWKQQGQHKEFWSGRAARSVDDAVKTITWAGKLPDVRDIYIAMGAQREAEQVTSKAGNHYLKPIRNQHNVAALKTVFLDIDVKDDGKGYPDQKTALAALLQFCADVDLPRPTLVVSSGGGVHCHWELDRSLSSAEWQPLANALAEATRQHGLKCDTQCTVDSARILRPPQTLNFKSDPPKPTRIIGKVTEGAYSVERIQRALEPYMKAGLPSQGNALVTLGAASSKFAGITNEAAAGITTSQPINIYSVADECPFIKEAIDTGGADFGQPLWNLTTLIATFADRDAAHIMAMGHPEYSEESTDALFDRKMKEREEKSLGWPSCGSILNAGCGSCRTCPHLKEGKSPLNYMPKPQLPATPSSALSLPKGYTLNKEGYISMSRVMEDGTSVLVPLLEYSISDAWAQKDPWVLHFSAVLHDNVKSKIELPSGVIQARDTLVKALAEHGMMTDPWVGKILPEFFVSWIKTLQSRKNAVVESSPYGWNTHQGQVDGFCYGGEVWTTNGSRPAPNADHVLRRQYQPTGSAEPWNEALKLVTGRGRPELEAIVASSFGAPLVKATGWYGAFMSVFSQESGIGKTTAMKVAQAVWGDPTTAMQQTSDTLNSVTNKIGMIRSLPLYWDEIKDPDDTKKFVRLAFQLTSGKEKSRLGRDANQREIGKWQTMLVSATNDSLLDYVAAQTSTTTAGLYRMFEYEVSKAKDHGKVETGDAQRMLGKLDDNFGNVGLEYAQWLGQNWQRVDQEVGEYTKRIEKTWGFKQDERFWLCTITCVVMGARYALELGLADFDVAAIEKFMQQTLQRMREHLKDTHVDLTNTTNVMNIFTQFLKAMHRNTLWTNKMQLGRGRPKAGDYKIIKDASRLEGINVHIAKDDKLIRVSSTKLSDWLFERGISRHIFTREFEKKFGAKKVIGRLGCGTDKAQGTEHLLEIMAAGTALASYVDDAEDYDGEN